MIGHPKYKIGDKVWFEVILDDDKKMKMIGEIYIVDKYGTFFDNSDVCYDIMADFSKEEKGLFKHINEKGVFPLD